MFMGPLPVSRSEAYTGEGRPYSVRFASDKAERCGLVSHIGLGKGGR